MPATIRLRTRVFVEECMKREWFSASSQARGLGLAVSSIWRILERDTAPGAAFIAAALTAFPDLTFDDLFELVEAEAEDAVA